MALVRLMARRRDQDVADVERQMESLRKQSKNKRGSKSRDAASQLDGRLTVASALAPMPKLYIETVGCQMNDAR